MGELTNIHTARIGVFDGEKRVRISPRETVEVGRDFTDHPMVKAELLKFEPGSTTGENGEKDDKPDPVTVADITGEDNTFTVRASDGIEFSPAKNQVRKDGTLTDGGIKAYEAAKAALSAE